MKFRVLSDSSCDITKEQEERYHIGIIPYYVSMDGVHYKKDRVEITAEEFYREMAEKLSKKLTKEQLIGIIDMLQVYCQQSEFNVGVGHMLGALAAELSAFLSSKQNHRSL